MVLESKSIIIARFPLCGRNTRTIFFALLFFGVEMWGFSVSGAVEENMGPPFLLARRRSYTKEDGAAKEI